MGTMLMEKESEYNYNKVLFLLILKMQTACSLLS